MGTIVAVGETEIDVASAEFHMIILIFFETVSLLIGSQDGGVVDGLTVFAFQHTAL